MAELFEQYVKKMSRQSSKGNQLKWENEGIWYKADFLGYEGLTEYVVSHLLKKSTLSKEEYVLYDLEEIHYKTQIYNGVKSQNFLNGEGEFAYCPMFDNGAGLLSDLKQDYPLQEDVHTLMQQVQAKTICFDFNEQLNISKAIYRTNLKFSFTKEDVNELLEQAVIYSEEERERVRTILYMQMRKYAYLWM